MILLGVDYKLKSSVAGIVLVVNIVSLRRAIKQTIYTNKNQIPQIFKQFLE